MHNLLGWLNCNVDFLFSPLMLTYSFLIYFIRYYFLTLYSHASQYADVTQICLPFSTCCVSLLYSATLCLSLLLQCSTTCLELEDQDPAFSWLPASSTKGKADLETLLVSMDNNQ